MSTTPPPPSRVRTPPAPFHGPRYDNWEPYSPKRTTRASSSLRMRRQSPDVFQEPTSSRKTQSRQYPITSTPRASSSQRPTSSSQTLSPPSSPEPEPEHGHATPHRPASTLTSTSTTASVRRSLFTSRDHLSHHHDAPTQSDSKPSPRAMLPTPSKTPRKTAASSTSMPTARILNFQPESVQHVMPTPRNQRKSRLTLFDEDAPQPDKISVFTDAQDRVPDLDESDDNPFVGPRKKTVKTAPRSTRAKALSPAHHDEDEDAAMEEAVRNQKGLIYVFRGKRIFRPFASSSLDSAPEPEHSEQSNLKRKAGAAAHRPITRSSLQPKLLWPSEDQLDDKAARQAALDQDEEADTDIEQDHVPMPVPLSAKDLVTPAKALSTQSAHILTPPSSHRATRSASKKMSFLSTLDPVAETAEPHLPPSPTVAPHAQQKSARGNSSPFENWRRTKPSLSAPTPVSTTKQGKKRAHSPQPSDYGVRKRTRAAPTSPEHV